MDFVAAGYRPDLVLVSSLGHEINIRWGAHIMHHHSETFNYTVSARITTLQAVVRNVFW
jgi:hypothetical protein